MGVPALVMIYAVVFSRKLKRGGSMAIINCEIKARCGDHVAVREYLKSKGADYKGIDHQIDTYFIVPNGRLKLREGNIENNLIHYDRSDRAGAKQSSITLYNSAPESTLKAVMTDALGILAVVDKQREIYFIENVKFHIDIVAGLGNFMEIEAIDTDGSIGQAKLDEQCEYYVQELKINGTDMIAVSYSDMLLQPSK
jgi:adenylate cyclase class 2